MVWIIFINKEIVGSNLGINIMSIPMTLRTRTHAEFPNIHLNPIH